MRSTRTILATLALCLTVTVHARAGIYSTVDITPWPLPARFRDFQLAHGELRAAPADLANRLAVVGLLVTADIGPAQGMVIPSRLLMYLPEGLSYVSRPTRGLHFLQQTRALEEKERRGDLTLDDRINLSAYYLYLNDPGNPFWAQKAIRVLTPAAGGEKPHFMVLANLATAFELTGIPERALNYRRQAIAAWPRSWPGWSTARLNSYLKIERLHLNLVQLRSQEGPRGAENLDDLFPRVRFVGPSGEFEPGTIAPAYFVEVPPDGLDQITQLVFWLPNDNRLYWLLGELLNARGEVVPAATVLYDLVENRKYTASRELRRHSQILQGARREAEVLSNELTSVVWGWLMWGLAPRGVGLSPGVGALASEGAGLAFTNEEAWQVLAGQYRSPRLEARSDAPPTEERGASSAQVPAWLPDWRHMAVGFVAGAIVMLLVQMQWRESRRRRQGMAEASRG